MTPIRIADPGDPRIAPYRSIRERDLVGRRDGFVAEGEVVLDRLVGASRYRPESVLVLETRLAALAPLLARCPADVPVYAASRDVIDSVAGFPLHRGVLAIGRKIEAPDAPILLASLPRDALVVGLVGLANHDNVGGIFRNAAAFGADAVLLDETCCDPLYRKAIRVSVGAALTVPFARGGTAAELVTGLEQAGFACFALSPSGDDDIGAVDWPHRTALLLGAEGPGLPADVMALSRGLRIPIRAGFDSLNVATASGIALHAVRSRPRAG